MSSENMSNLHSVVSSSLREEDVKQDDPRTDPCYSPSQATHLASNVPSCAQEYFKRECLEAFAEFEEIAFPYPQI